MYRTSLISNSRAARFTAILALLALCVSTQAQKDGKSPTETALTFYRALKAKRYLDGFRHSVYRNAVEGLTSAELQDLEPDFARTFASIPDRIEPSGEKITGQMAAVSLKFGESKELQSVTLIRIGNEWLVGDQETLALVNAQGRAFFFNTRMQVNESEAYEMLQRIIGAEIIYSRKFEGKNASLAELIRLGGVPKDLEDGEASGYHFSLTVGADEKTFFAAATPTTYGKTGRISFYADINGIRGEDLKGQPATARSSIHHPK
ncbi:MAG TPA: hypothetical protein VGL29_07185 [Blastocatellia bacterium]